MKGLHCPECRARFTNVTVEDGAVKCPSCGEVVFTVPPATTQGEFRAALSREYFTASASQLARFVPGVGALAQQKRLLLVDHICAKLMIALPE